MTLTLIAEILAGETWISPGGAVDSVTACGLEPFLWERWIHDAAAAESIELGVELDDPAAVEGAAVR